MVVVKFGAKANAALGVLRHTEPLLRSGRERAAGKCSPRVSAHYSVCRKPGPQSILYSPMPRNHSTLDRLPCAIRLTATRTLAAAIASSDLNTGYLQPP